MKAKQFFYLSIGLTITMCALIALVLFQGSQTLKTMSLQTSDLLADRDVSLEKITKLQTAKNDSTKVESISLLLDRLLPDAKDQDTLIANIIFTATSEARIPESSIASLSFGNSGLPDALSGTEKSTIAPEIYEYPFTAQLQDISYSTLINLLSALETNGRLIQVDNVQITPDEENPSYLSVNLSMKAYVRP